MNLLNLRANTAARTTALPGPSSCRLARGCVLTFQPHAAGRLRVNAGRAWVTGDLAHGTRTSHAAPQSYVDDHFVTPEHDLALEPGQNVVVEAWPAPGSASICLVWEPDTVAVR